MTESTLRIGILSCAHPAHAGSYIHWLRRQPGVEVAAIYDDDPRRAAWFGERFGISRLYDTPQPILADPTIDVVVVCSPTIQHRQFVVAAAAAGKHVLCEKPIATTLEDARAMIDVCAAAGVQLHIPFVCRFYPTVQKAKTLLADGSLGMVQGIVGMNRGIPPLPPVYPAWITDTREAGGGALIDHSVHVTDAMRYLMGAEATRVSAETGTLFSPSLMVEDSALLLLNFDNGAIGSVDPSWSVPASNPWHYDFALRILCDDGAIVLDDTRQSLNVAAASSGGRGFHLEGFGVNVDEAMIAHFVHCLRTGALVEPAASGEDGYKALEIALAAYRSVELGKPVSLAESPSFRAPI